MKKVLGFGFFFPYDNDQKMQQQTYIVCDCSCMSDLQKNIVKSECQPIRLKEKLTEKYFVFLSLFQKLRILMVVQKVH